MKRVLILFLTILSYGIANAQTMQRYMVETRKLVDDGKYPEALKRTIWFHDHALEKEPAMSAVRTSFALSDWKKLGDKYPPALKALKDDRDKKTKLALSKGDKDAFVDAIAIDRTLGENKRTVELFKTLSAKHPDKARSCWYYAKDALFDAKEYAIIKKYIGSPSEEFESIKRLYNTTMGPSANISVVAQAMMKRTSEARFVNGTLKLIDYALAVKDPKGAKYVQQEALKIVKSDQLEKALSK